MGTDITTMTLEEALDLALQAIDARISYLLTEAFNTDDRDIRVKYSDAVIAYAIASKLIREDITQNTVSQS